MRRINIDGKDHDIPTAVSELSEEQYLAAATILCNYEESSADLIRLELAKVVLPFTEEEYDEWKNDCITESGEEHGPDRFYEELGLIASDVTEFLFEVNDDGDLTYDTSGFTRNVFPKIETEKGKFFGPEDALKNITIYELAILFTEYDAYLSDKDEAHLHKIIAVMYRPPKKATPHNLACLYEGDIRLPVRKYERTIPRRIDLFSRLDTSVKDLIIFYFACSRVQIINTFPSVFPQGGSSNKASLGWAEIIWELAENIVNIEKVDDQKAYDTLAYLQNLYKKNN